MLKYFMEERIFSSIVTVLFLTIALSLAGHNFVSASLFQFRHQWSLDYAFLFVFFKKNSNDLNWLRSQI